MMARYLTIVPTKLSGKVDTKKATVGQAVTTIVPQLVKLADGTELPKGTKIVGKVTQVKAHSKQCGFGAGARLGPRRAEGRQAVALRVVIRTVANAAGMNAAGGAPMVGGSSMGGGGGAGGEGGGGGMAGPNVSVSSSGGISQSGGAPPSGGPRGGGGAAMGGGPSGHAWRTTWRRRCSHSCRRAAHPVGWRVAVRASDAGWIGDSDLGERRRRAGR